MWLYYVVYIVLYIVSGCIKGSKTVLKIWSQTCTNGITWKLVTNARLSDLTLELQSKTEGDPQKLLL